MTKYIMWGSYCENALEKRTPYRPAHLDGLSKQKESGILIPHSALRAIARSATTSSSEI